LAGVGQSQRWWQTSCDLHTVNNAVSGYRSALFEEDRKRVNQASAIGLDEASFVGLGPTKHTTYTTTVADLGTARRF
jgi:transposase